MSTWRCPSCDVMWWDEEDPTCEYCGDEGEKCLRFQGGMSTQHCASPEPLGIIEMIRTEP